MGEASRRRGPVERVEAVEGEDETGGEQTHHERLGVDAGDEVEQHERVGHPEPQGRDVGDAAPHGEARHRPAQQEDADDLDEAVQHRPGDDVVAGERVDHPLDTEEERSVLVGGVPPHVGNVDGQRMVGAEGGDGAGRVRIPAETGDRPLRQVAVDVLGEHRRREREGERPRGDEAVHVGATHAPHRAPAAVEAERVAAEREPTERDDDHADHHEGHRGVLDAQPQAEQALAHRGILHHGQRARAERSRGHEHGGRRADSPENPESGGVGLRQTGRPSLVGVEPRGHRSRGATDRVDRHRSPPDRAAPAWGGSPPPKGAEYFRHADVA